MKLNNPLKVAQMFFGHQNHNPYAKSYKSFVFLRMGTKKNALFSKAVVCNDSTMATDSTRMYSLLVE